MQHLLSVLSFVLAVTGGSLVALASAPPVPGAPVLVIGGGGPSGRAALVRGSGGALIGLRDAPLATLALSPAPGFARALRANGAWAVLDGRRFSALCGSLTPGLSPAPARAEP